MQENKRNKEEYFIEKRMSCYDNFKCIADKCKFTCCSGWDINVDNNTYDKWKKEHDKCNYVLDKLNIIKDSEYIIVDKEISAPCPFLDSKGLCEIVKNNGDEYLSVTCQMFPRIENIFEGIKELTLSCSCPEVVDIIEAFQGEIELNELHNKDMDDLPIEFNIRDTIVKVIKQKDISIEDKLIVSYNMILNILENDELTEELVLEILNKYKNRDYIENIVHNLRSNMNYNKSLRAINNLFLDITENYKSVPVLVEALKDISNVSIKIYKGKVKVNELLEQKESFINNLYDYNLLIENCIISKVFSSCINEDIEEIAIAVQLILLEYVLVRYSVFLKMFLGDRDNLVQNIKEYIVVFSRIIGNNMEAVIEFIEEQFGYILVNCEYLELISMI